jgi:hypothetical protein
LFAARRRLFQRLRADGGGGDGERNDGERTHDRDPIDVWASLATAH